MEQPPTRPYAGTSPTAQPVTLPTEEGQIESEIKELDLSGELSKLLEQDVSQPGAEAEQSAPTSSQTLIPSGDDNAFSGQGLSSEDWKHLQNMPAEDAVPIGLPVHVDMPESDHAPIQDTD
eukprot:3434404-Pyramimonas_sp.AAC.1